MALSQFLSNEIKIMKILNSLPGSLFGSGGLFFKRGFRGWGLIQSFMVKVQEATFKIVI